jgi:hypothetical protein
MKTSGLIAALLILFSGAGLFGADLPAQSSNSVQNACAELLSIKCFAFGGVGYAGTTSKGELAFRAVLTSTNALELFETILSKGTDEAKLYALCGIRSLHREAFDTAAKKLRAADPKVSTVSGCLLTEEKVSAVIQRITDGAYDNYFKR